MHPAVLAIKGIMAAYPELSIDTVFGDLAVDVPVKRAEQLLTIRQTCDRLSVKRNTIYNLINAGQLKPVYVGNKKTLPRLKESEVAKLQQ